MYSYAYTIPTLISVPFWFLLYAKHREFRRPMLIMGFYVSTGAVFTDSIWSTHDYWNPGRYLGIFNFSLQEAMFGFIFGGLVSVFHELFSQKALIAFCVKPARIIILSLSYFAPFIIGTDLMKINSIYSNIFGLCLSFLIIIFNEKRLLPNAITSGIFSVTFALIIYNIYLRLFPDIFKDWWFLSNLSGFYFLDIPIEEIVWFTAFGMTVGPAYRYLHTD